MPMRSVRFLPQEEEPGQTRPIHYMYTDLATLYEEPADLKARGSITLIPILTVAEMTRLTRFPL